MPTGQKVFLDFAGRVWAVVPASGPTLKRFGAVLVWWWDGEQIKFPERKTIFLWVENLRDRFSFKKEIAQ